MSNFDRSASNLEVKSWIHEPDLQYFAARHLRQVRHVVVVHGRVAVVVVFVGGILVPQRVRRRVKDKALGIEHHVVSNVELAAVVKGDGVRDSPMRLLWHSHVGRGKDVVRGEDQAHKAHSEEETLVNQRPAEYSVHRSLWRRLKS